MTSASHSKPAPYGTTPVWANNRQAICDSLPYYKSHEGSVYTSGNIAKGLLISGHVAPRDMMGSEVIITTLGGGREMNKATGQMERVKEGSKIAYNACFAAMRQVSPVGVVTSNKYPMLPVQVDHPFSVLAFFTITDMWSEAEIGSKGAIAVWKIRLEKTDRTTPSWWQAGDEVQHTVRPREFPSNRIDCIDCGNASKQIFLQGWTCLNGQCDQSFTFPPEVNPQELSFASNHAAPLAWCVKCQEVSKTVFSCGWVCLNRECAAHLKFAGGLSLDDATYSDDFLRERTAHDLSHSALPQLRPDLPVLEVPNTFGTEKEMRVGIVCPKCNCCARRACWNRWIYENPACSFVLDAKPRPYPLKCVRGELIQQQKKRNFSEIHNHLNLPPSTHTINGYMVEQYLLPDLADKSLIIGSVTIFRATQRTNTEAGGSNAMWKSLQIATTENFGLRRNAVVHPGLTSEKLTRNFLQNWGAPYKFAVAVSSKAFAEAPESIVAGLKRLQWAGRISIEKTNERFQDSPQNMSRDQTITDEFVDFNELLTLGYMEDDKISFHDDGEDTLGPTVATLSLGSPAVMRFRKKKKSRVGSSVVLKFPLCHGDMVVMHGNRIHQFYEHAVDPKGKRRFALTSRNIVLDKLDPNTRAEAVKKSVLPQVSPIWEYPKPPPPPKATTQIKRPNSSTHGEGNEAKRPKTQA